MADDVEVKKDVKEQKSEKPNGDAAELAVAEQEKSEEQKHTEDERQEARKEYKTVSSACLPKLDWKALEGKMVPKSGDKLDKYGNLKVPRRSIEMPALRPEAKGQDSEGTGRGDSKAAQKDKAGKDQADQAEQDAGKAGADKGKDAAKSGTIELAKLGGDVPGPVKMPALPEDTDGVKAVKMPAFPDAPDAIPAVEMPTIGSDGGGNGGSDGGNGGSDGGSNGDIKIGPVEMPEDPEAIGPVKMPALPDSPDDGPGPVKMPTGKGDGDEKRSQLDKIAHPDHPDDGIDLSKLPPPDAPGAVKMPTPDGPDDGPGPVKMPTLPDAAGDGPGAMKMPTLKAEVSNLTAGDLQPAVSPDGRLQARSSHTLSEHELSDRDLAASSHALNLQTALVRGDEAAVVKILEGKTATQKKDILAAYQKTFGNTLEHDLKENLSAKDYDQVVMLTKDYKITKNQDNSQTRTYEDNARVEVRADGRVRQAVAADKREREFKYDDKGELVEIKSTFTGHTWKKVNENGKEAWVNEKGTVWRGMFGVDEDGNLAFRTDKGTEYIFRRDGKTVKLNADGSPGQERDTAPVVERTSTRDAGKEKSKEAQPTPEQQKAVDTGKASQDLINIGVTVRGGKPDAAKVIEALKDNTPEQTKIVKELYKKAYGVELEDDLKAKFPGNREISKAFDLLGTPPDKRVDEKRVAEATSELVRNTVSLFSDIENVNKVLQNSNEAEIKAIKAKYKEITGQELAEALADEFSGLELKKAQNYLNRKDGDGLVQIPKNVDEKEMNKAIVEIHTASLRMHGMYEEDTIDKVLAGKTPDEIKVMDALYMEKYGVSLNDQLMHMMLPRTLEQRVADANKARAEAEQFKINHEANKIHTATGWFGDASAITEALAGKTEAEKKAVDDAFKKMHGVSIEEHLKEELDEPELSKALELLHKKDADLAKIPEGVDRIKMREANEEIHKLKNDEFFGVDREQYYKALAGKTPEQLEAMNTLFKERYGVTVEEHLKEISGPFESAETLQEFAEAANKWDAEEKAFQKEVESVDRARVDQLVQQAEEARKAPVPVQKMGMLSVPGWNPGDHPVEKMLQDLSAAELKAFRQQYKEKHGYDFKDVVSDLPYGAGDRIGRLLDRDRESALNKLTPAERADARERAEALYHAMKGDGTREGAVYRALEKQSDLKREAIKEAFRELTGDSAQEWIEDDFSGDEELKALNYLNYGSRDEAASMNLMLSENEFSKVRSMIMTMDSKQIAALDKTYQSRYGKSLSDAILNDDDIGPKNKAALEIYLKGRENLKPEDWSKIAEISLGDYDSFKARLVAAHQHENVGDLGLFKEVMASAPPAVREQFMKDGGAEKIVKAFTNDISDALEYAKNGSLSTARMIDKNDCVDDDEDAIEKALHDMPWKGKNGEIDPSSERELYRRGARLQKEYEARQDMDEKERAIAIAFNSMPKVPTDNLSEADKKAVETYRRINSSIDGPCDDSECTNWRNEAIYPGGEKAITEEINGFSPDDWKKLKENPAEREKFIKEHGIDIMSEGTSKKLTKLLDEKLAAGNFSDVQYVGVKPLAEYLKPRQAGMATLPPDAQKLLEGIEQMSLKDQELYRTNSEYRESVDKVVDLVMNDAQKEAARHMLDAVAAGKYPENDFIDKINIEGGKSETDETRVARLVEDEFRKSEQRGDKPTLHERVSDPKTPADEALKKRLDTALHHALEDDEYERWAEPLLKNGRLTIEEKMELDKEKGDKKSTFTDLRTLANAEDKASAEERHKLVTDENYRERVLGNLPEDQRNLVMSMMKHGEERHRIMTDAGYREQVLKTLNDKDRETAIKILAAAEKDPQFITNAQRRDAIINALKPEERQIAESVLKLGSLTPEDAVRGHVLGLGVSKEEMIDSLKELTPAQNATFRDQYADKYHEDVVSVLEDKLKGKDEDMVLREIRIDPLTVREALQDVKEVVDSSNSGFGASVTKVWASGAGDMAEGKVLELQGKLARGEPLTVDEAMKIANDAYEYTELFEAAKVRTADQLSDIVLSVATIAVPGGMALRGLLVISALGGGAKVAMKYAITGDASFTDFASGMVDTALSAVGPAQIGKAVGLGKRAATNAAEKIIAKGLIKEGEEVAFKNGLRGLTANAIHEGNGIITDKALDKIVNRVAKGATGAERSAVRQAVKETLEAELKSEIRTGVRKWVTNSALDAGAGFMGGSGGGLVRGIADWDSDKSFSENVSHVFETAAISGAFGAGGALAFSNGFRMMGAGWRFVRGKGAHAPNIAGEVDNLAQSGEVAIARPHDAPPPKGDAIEVTPDALKGEYKRVGDSDYYIDNEGRVFKHAGDGAAGKTKLQHDPEAGIAIKEEAAARLEKAAASAESSDVRPRAGSKARDVQPVSNEMLANNLPAELQHLSGPERAALIARVAKEPLFQPAAMGQFAEGAGKLKADWPKLNPAERAERLQQLMDGFADSQGIARVKVEVVPDQKLGPIAGNYEDGVIKLKQSEVSTGDIDNLLERTYHEFAHNEQDNVILRNLADELKIGKEATPDQITALEKRYRQATRGEISENHIKEVMRVREGKPLSPDEALRARQAAESFHDYPFRTPEAQDAMKYSGTVQQEFNKLLGVGGGDTANASRNLVGRLSEDRELSRALFGTDVPPPKVQDLIDKYKNLPADKWPKAEADELLKELVGRRNTDIYETTIKAMTDYTKNANEQAAHLLGAKSRLEMNARQVEAPYPYDRFVNVGNEKFELRRYPDSTWFWGGKGAPMDAPIKVHVTTSGPKDLGEVQRVLIPALNKDPELQRLVANWKTFDPNFGVGRIKPGDKIPTGVGNDGKGFTIYLNNPADAARVQKRIDEILSKSGLSLDKPIPTGNVDKIAGASNRVGVVRDAYPFTYTKENALAFKLDDELSAKMHADAGVQPGQRMRESKLREIEKATGIKPNTLDYDAEGNLVLVAVRHGKAPSPDDPEAFARGLYAEEANAVKTPGELTDRPALYAIADKYGMDQAELFASRHTPTAPHEGPSPSAAGSEHATDGEHHTTDDGPTRRDTARQMEAVEPKNMPDRIHGSDEIHDLADNPAPERELIDGFVQRNPLAKTEVVKDFATRSADVTDRWHDLSPALDKASAEMQTAQKSYQTGLVDKVKQRAGAADGSLDNELDRLFKSPESVDDLISNGAGRIPDVAKKLGVDEKKLEKIYHSLESLTPDEHLVLANRLHAQEKLMEARDAVHTVQTERLAELQKMADEFAQANDLPKVKIEMAKDRDMGSALGYYLDDTITLRESAFTKNANPTELARVLYHEIVHSQQNLVMVRRVLDDLGAQTPAIRVTAEQMEKLQELRNLEAGGTQLSNAQAKELTKLSSLYDSVRTEFHAASKEPLSLERLTAILKTPAREVLEDSPLRGRVLNKAFREKGGFAEFDRARRELKLIGDELDNLDAPDGARQLLGKMDNDSELQKKLFGNMLSDEEKRQLIKVMGDYNKYEAGLTATFPETEAQDLLRRLMARNQDHTQIYHDAHYRQYIAGIHETEAAIIDRMAMREAEAIAASRAARNTQPHTARDFPDEKTGEFERTRSSDGDFDDEPTDVTGRPDFDDEPTQPDGKVLEKKGVPSADPIDTRARSGSKDATLEKTVDSSERTPLDHDDVNVRGSRLVDRQIFFNGKQLKLVDGEVTIGRSDVLASGAQDDIVSRVVSRNHGTLRFDGDSGNYVWSDTSTNGTFIRRAGGTEFEKVTQGEIVIRPGDDVRLGSENGPRLKLNAERGKFEDDIVTFERADGIVREQADGRRAIYDRAGTTRYENADGQVTHVTGPGGNRVFEYGADKKLTKVDMGDKGVLERQADGRWHHTDANGTKVHENVEALPDGSVKLSDGTHPDIVHLVDGSMEIHQPNGRVEYLNANLDLERQKLMNLADAHWPDRQQSDRFKYFMQEFEGRVRATGMDPAESARTFHQINRLIGAGAESTLSKEERVFLAQQILDQAARPHNIDQGINNTCNVTGVEHRIFSQSPADASRLITDVAVTGKYVTVDGSVIDLTRVPGGLRPDAEARLSMDRGFDSRTWSDIRFDGKRTFASQIFETTAVNIKWRKSADFPLQPGEVVRYEKPYGPVPGTTDTGERLYKYSTGPDGRVTQTELSKTPHIYEYELTDISNQITGRNEIAVAIRGPGWSTADMANKTGAFIVNTEIEFQNLLLTLQETRKFPFLVAVDVVHPPWGNGTGAGGGHIVNVTSIFYDAPSRRYMVEVNNSWGSEHNLVGARAIPVDMLFNATRRPGT